MSALLKHFCVTGWGEQPLRSSAADTLDFAGSKLGGADVFGEWQGLKRLPEANQKCPIGVQQDFPTLNQGVQLLTYCSQLLKW